MKGFNFITFVVTMGSLLLFVLGWVLYGAAIALKWIPL